ncbi:MAG TPA: hypothetical protein VL068_10930, partial [Microthrixaceae bacterium]|nr:hypothetical protein [Microthrixaceae bacterium]
MLMKRAALIGGVVLVLAIAAAAIMFRPTGGTAVDKADAVDSFRKSQKSQNSASSDAATSAQSGSQRKDDVSKEVGVPPAGVYTYLATGESEMKLGPLPAENRVLPSEIVVGVTDAKSTASAGDESGVAERCFTLQLNLFVEHVEVTQYCGPGDSLRIDQHDKTLKIGPVTANASLGCEPKILIAVGSPVDKRACKLKLSGGPIGVEANFEGSTEIGEQTQLEVAGKSIDVLPVTVSYIASGSVTGTWNERFWMATDNWLPVRIERDVALVGPATITEKSEL